MAGVVQGEGESDERERAVRVVSCQGIGSASEMAVQGAKTARTAPHACSPESIDHHRGMGLMNAYVGGNDADDPLAHHSLGLDRAAHEIATGHGAESCRGRRI
ncbi:hypothetical protein H9623_18435 [Oerskovia sp. Sa1BUA8]|uniref:Uncharacterized protein n=1 Tax=Oerskovia douganii TaxID=2762210 RepID=A0A9D5UBX1_9CELL|nr:hypothetical protein [Oerskovia douganii]MBE7702273.1 hypothetical protein [Oerskovia douganii]